jgi:hypothetical protein
MSNRFGRPLGFSFFHSLTHQSYPEPSIDPIPLTTIFYELKIEIKGSLPKYPSRGEGASRMPSIVSTKPAVLPMLSGAV